MLHTDLNQAIVPDDFKGDPVHDRPPVVRVVDLSDQTISAGYKSADSEHAFEEFNRRISHAMARDIIDKLARGYQVNIETDKLAEHLSSWVLSYASAREKGRIFALVLQKIPAADSLITAVLENIEYGAALSPPEAAEFFTAAQDATAVDTPELIARTIDQLQAKTLTAALIRASLYELATGLKDKRLRQYYTDPLRTDEELLGVLAYVNSEDRIKLMETVIKAIKVNPEISEYAKTELNNIFHFAEAGERAALVESMLSDSALTDNISTVIKSAADLNEITDIIKAVGKDKLLATQNATVRELVALAEIAGTIRNINFPDELAQSASVEQIEKSLEHLEQALEEWARIARDSELADTRTARDFLGTALYNLEYLRAEKQLVKSPEDLIELVNFMTLKSSIERQYGVALTHQEPDFWGPGAKWTIEEIKDVKLALDTLGEGLVLTTPLLTEIQRVDSLGEYVMGQRFPNGLIRIANFAVNNDYVSKTYAGQSSLVVTLVHEIGHGVQLGENDIFVDEHNPDGLKLGSGDPRYDFEGYMELSGWKAIDPERWEFTSDHMAIILDGEVYPLGVPIKHHGEEITLIYNQGILYSHDSYAPFSLITYSRTNPWEDWAESFAEYHLMPERLIQFAPEKFRYFEEEFHKYENNSRLQKLLDESLRRRAEKYGDQDEQEERKAA